MDHITWVRERSWDSGEVGGMGLFRLYTLNDRNLPEAALQCRLPHVEPSRVMDSDRDKLKAIAEEMLASFVQRLGAAFPDA
jgi:hypothetical protein